MSKVIGIDLGTTTTMEATIKDGRAQAADNREGNKITPSVVHFAKDGKTTVGERALNMALVAPHYVVTEVKRMDVAAYTHPDTGKEYSPIEISSFILKDVIQAAAEYYGDEIVGVVITVPAYFSDKEREATRKAGELAGLKVLKIINEPTAAMLAYLQLHPNLAKGKYAVMDLGGGTLDVTIIEVTDGEPRVLTTDGIRRCGGTDFTRAIEQAVLDEFKKQHGIEFDPNVSEDAAVLQEIREKAERAKRELSKLDETIVNVIARGKAISMTFTRAQFEELSYVLLDGIREKWLSAVQAGGRPVTHGLTIPARSAFPPWRGAGGLYHVAKPLSPHCVATHRPSATPRTAVA